MTPDKVRHNGLSENLGSDFIAVDALGNILARANTIEAVHRAAPEAAATFTGSDFIGLDTGRLTETVAGDNTAFAAVMAQVDPGVLKDYERPAIVTQAGATVTAADDRDANVASAEPTRAESDHPVVDGSAFDHDGDGKVGGSRKASRQRKPSGQ